MKTFSIAVLLLCSALVEAVKNGSGRQPGSIRPNGSEEEREAQGHNLRNRFVETGEQMEEEEDLQSGFVKRPSQKAPQSQGGHDLRNRYVPNQPVHEEMVDESYELRNRVVSKQHKSEAVLDTGNDLKSGFVKRGQLNQKAPMSDDKVVWPNYFDSLPQQLGDFIKEGVLIFKSIIKNNIISDMLVQANNEFERLFHAFASTIQVQRKDNSYFFVFENAPYQTFKTFVGQFTDELVNFCASKTHNPNDQKIFCGSLLTYFLRLTAFLKQFGVVHGKYITEDANRSYPTQVQEVKPISEPKLVPIPLTVDKQTTLAQKPTVIHHDLSKAINEEDKHLAPNQKDQGKKPPTHTTGSQNERGGAKASTKPGQKPKDNHIAEALFQLNGSNPFWINVHFSAMAGPIKRLIEQCSKITPEMGVPQEITNQVPFFISTVGDLFANWAFVGKHNDPNDNQYFLYTDEGKVNALVNGVITYDNIVRSSCETKEHLERFCSDFRKSLKEIQRVIAEDFYLNTGFYEERLDLTNSPFLTAAGVPDPENVHDIRDLWFHSKPAKRLNYLYLLRKAEDVMTLTNNPSTENAINSSLYKPIHKFYESLHAFLLKFPEDEWFLDWATEYEKILESLNAHVLSDTVKTRKQTVESDRSVAVWWNKIPMDKLNGMIGALAHHTKQGSSSGQAMYKDIQKAVGEIADKSEGFEIKGGKYLESAGYEREQIRKTDVNRPMVQITKIHMNDIDNAKDSLDKLVDDFNNSSHVQGASRGGRKEKKPADRIKMTGVHDYKERMPVNRRKPKNKGSDVEDEDTISLRSSGSQKDINEEEEEMQVSPRREHEDTQHSAGLTKTVVEKKPKVVRTVVVFENFGCSQCLSDPRLDWLSA